MSAICTLNEVIFIFGVPFNSNINRLYLTLILIYLD